MNYIKDTNKLNKIREMANGGDIKARNFLMNFMSMSDEEANAYLSSIAVDNPGIPKPENINTTQEDANFKQVIKDLIKDENEAIDGYDKAIKFIANSHFCEEPIKQGYIQKLEHIKNEEIEHIEELKELM